MRLELKGSGNLIKLKWRSIGLKQTYSNGLKEVFMIKERIKTYSKKLIKTLLL